MVMAESFFVTFHKSPLPSLMETSRRTLDNFLNITFSPPWILYGLSHNIIGLRRLPFSSYGSRIQLSSFFSFFLFFSFFFPALDGFLPVVGMYEIESSSMSDVVRAFSHESQSEVIG